MNQSQPTPPAPASAAPRSACVAISDSNFFIAVFALILSIKYYGVRTRTHILSCGMTEREKALLKQFDGTEVIEADPSNPRGPACRKGEAILAAAAIDPTVDYISLLDGDCVVTGDISDYLTPAGETIFARLKTPDEDGGVFRTRYEPGETFGTIPRRVLKQWREDVGERQESAIRNTACGGNLTVHRKVLPFVERWQQQINRVLPEDMRGAHHFASLAYSQVDESVLNSLLAFAEDAPVCQAAMFNLDPSAYLAHLGPNHPKPWVLWRPDKLRYYPIVAKCFTWAREQGYELPKVPWTFKSVHRPWVYLSSHAYGTAQKIKHAVSK